MCGDDGRLLEAEPPGSAPDAPLVRPSPSARSRRRRWGRSAADEAAGAAVHPRTRRMAPRAGEAPSGRGRREGSCRDSTRGVGGRVARREARRRADPRACTRPRRMAPVQVVKESEKTRSDEPCRGLHGDGFGRHGHHFTNDSADAALLRPASRDFALTFIVRHGFPVSYAHERREPSDRISGRRIERLAARCDLPGYALGGPRARRSGVVCVRLGGGSRTSHPAFGVRARRRPARNRPACGHPHVRRLCLRACTAEGGRRSRLRQRCSS